MADAAGVDDPAVAARVLAGWAPDVAQRLLGATLRNTTAEGTMVVRITEVEAYDESEPAAHTHAGRTPRTAPMFRAGGHLYVYLSYGIHRCVNIVCGPPGRGAAVLVRSGTVLQGRDLAVARRGGSDRHGRAPDAWVAQGPGRLGQAMGFTLAQSGAWVLGDGPTQLQLGPPVNPGAVVVGPRVGISRAVDLPWRFRMT